MEDIQLFSVKKIGYNLVVYFKTSQVHGQLLWLYYIVQDHDFQQKK